MMPDHFDIFDDEDPNMGRWCKPCKQVRHADCGPICQADRHDDHPA